MSFTYTKNVPDPPHNPSSDVGNMQQNTTSIFNWVEVDHVGFNEALAGQHKFVEFPSNITPTAPAGAASEAHTELGTASPTASELFFRNKDAQFLLSAIKAFGVVNGVTGNLINGYNCTSSGGAGNYTITLNASVVTGTQYLVLLGTSPRNGGGFGDDLMVINYRINSATSIQITTANSVAQTLQAVISFSFAVLQL